MAECHLGVPIALALAAYLVGSIPVGYLVGRWRRGIDVREYGTGNPGASNVYRNVGPAEGIGVALACGAQGLWPVLVTRSLGYPPLAAGLVGLAAAVGYAWPVFLRFRGGRAVATCLGVLVGLWPGPVAALAVCFALGLLLDRYAFAMFVGFAALPAYLWLTGEAREMVALTIGIYVFLLGRRLSGVRADLHGAQCPAEIVLQRLLHDRRPGQRLVGKRGT